ncbi:hypothetical protein [Turicibacter bilis]|uniref:Uncharacterized protein n=1 Tax=Turicibacter bilis TaxID=2735723 RepID=A0ABY5JKH3_9FIRM|nr:hypothetical protein [Turicibacter bilis]MBS3201437.1 hypothetical protein [Turicibacter bilis]UUF06052.1 hypothetical protein J0J69_00195 [Turicibacter bilis]
MFGKLKKQKSRSPVEEMEQFYLNQFLNNPKIPPQGYNGMPQNGPGLNPMMGPNNSTGPQFQGQNGMGTPIGGFNSMINNSFNQNQVPMAANNFTPNQLPMMNNNLNPNQMPMMNNSFNTNPYPMMENNFNQTPMMNNNVNSNPLPMMNNSYNQNPYTMMNNNFQQTPQMTNPMNTNPYNNFNTNQLPMMNNLNTNQLPNNNNNFNQPQIPSLINDTITSNIGAEPSPNTSFPGQFSFNDFSFSQPVQQTLPDLTPSLEDLTGTNILSNQYFRPNSVLTSESGTGAETKKEIQTMTSSTPINNPTLTPTNSAGSTNPNIPTIQVDPAVPSPPPPILVGDTMQSTATSPFQVPQSYPSNQLATSVNPYPNYSAISNQSIDIYDIKNKVDNINIRLRKVESYLGFRPETTI